MNFFSGGMNFVGGGGGGGEVEFWRRGLGFSVGYCVWLVGFGF